MEFPSAEIGYAVCRGLFKRGVMTAGTLNNAKTFRIEPPGIISKQTMNTVIQRLDEALAEVEKEYERGRQLKLFLTWHGCLMFGKASQPGKIPFRCEF